MQTSTRPAKASTQTAARQVAWLNYLQRAIPLLIAMFVFAVFARTFHFGLYFDYPEYYIKQIEQKLRQAGKLTPSGAQ